MAANDFGLSKIGQIAVNAHDLDRATAFYRDKLGMRLLFEVPPRMSFFDCDGIRLMLSLPDKPEFDHASSIIYFVFGLVAWAGINLSFLTKARSR